MTKYLAYYFLRHGVVKQHMYVQQHGYDLCQETKVRQ